MDFDILLIILLSIIVILCIFIIIKEREKNDILKKTKIKDLENLFKERWDEEEKNFKLKEKALLVQEKIIESRVRQLEAIFNEKENQYKAINQDLDFYRKGKIEEIDNSAAEYEKRKQLLIDASIANYKEQRNNLYNKELKEMEEKRLTLLKELETIQETLEVERNKRAAINEEIKRARKIEEQQDFYKIQIDPKDIDDIKLLRSITSRLRHPEVINKVIWSGYYQKPLAELRRRAGIDGSGIYKITRLKTGEIYIGQAKKISDRWAQHCKAALGVGNLASSQLHRVMSEDGPEQFTWEVIEQVPEDKLKERESYYIDFYDSKNYGLNAVRGDQTNK